MENGIAIPHCKTPVVDKLYTLLAVKKEGVDFDALDGKPSCIFIMTVSPDNRTVPHIQFLGEISRLLNQPSVKERVLNAKTKEEILQVL